MNSSMDFLIPRTTSTEASSRLSQLVMALPPRGNACNLANGRPAYSIGLRITGMTSASHFLWRSSARVISTSRQYLENAKSELTSRSTISEPLTAFGLTCGPKYHHYVSEWKTATRCKISASLTSHSAWQIGHFSRESRQVQTGVSHRLTRRDRADYLSAIAAIDSKVAVQR